MDFDTFNRSMSPKYLASGREDPIGYTYIAKSKDGLVYKVGFTRNPSKREKHFYGVYKPFGFKITHLFKGNIERDLIWAFFVSEAHPAVPLTKPYRFREAFYFSQNEIEHILKWCGFRPREEFEL